MMKQQLLKSKSFSGPASRPVFDMASSPGQPRHQTNAARSFRNFLLEVVSLS
jgi:hypothetical protein